ncbi:MAG: hypothetical protein WBC63_02775, partial [Candidatus Bipolaricaulia bacterium]
IVISSRAASEIWIIDHALTSAEAAGDAGDLLYRYGNPAAYGGSGSQVLVDQHDAEFIYDELLAGGNSQGVAGSSSGTWDGSGIRILVFDNGNPRSRPYSRVVELDLPDYSAPGSSQVLPAQIVWQYPSHTSDASVAFFSDHISGAQRLDSGNTLICSGVEGRFFEVTPDGEIVWEYVNPFTSTTPDGKEGNEVFRAEAYSAAFIGQNLEEAAEIGASSSLPQAAQNVALAQQPGAGGPAGIASISPTSLVVGSGEQLVTISLDQQLAPPEFVQFTSVAIGPIEATGFTRDGLTVRAWFDLPATMRPGTPDLTVTFPGRENEPITFVMPSEIR